MTTLTQGAFTQASTPVPAWFVSVGHPLVQQRFYAALDDAGSICWTDDRTQAQRFAMREDAARFAALFCAEEDWSLDP